MRTFLMILLSFCSSGNRLACGIGRWGLGWRDLSWRGSGHAGHAGLRLLLSLLYGGFLGHFLWQQEKARHKLDILFLLVSTGHHDITEESTSSVIT